MSAIELLPFQVAAATQIAERFGELWADEHRPYIKRNWPVPYYQALSALTGAGKTPILADAVSQIRARLPSEPLVLWISKTKAVVDQTYANLITGGKYSHLLEGFHIEFMSGATPDQVLDPSLPLALLSTTASFNQSDRADGTLRVHQVSADSGSEPLWTLFRRRKVADGRRRPMIVVYDEGHNLSDQQTDLLLELEPDVVLLASATMRIPEKLAKVVDRLRDHKGNDFLVTQVASKDVVTAGLVKRRIVLGGYSTVIESALDDLIIGMRGAEAKATAMGAGFMPKAIYVCRTNVSQDDGQRDDPARPFTQRRAPPILIWRHLVEKCQVDPAIIAVYCNLKFDQNSSPPPESLRLLSGGPDDFTRLSEGGFRHIIFNLSLQEGWDDPACCFAYIDKTMGSRVQVEQVIGRVLRQPNARHYPDADLNTASFYIRMDDVKQEFPEILESVKTRIAAEFPEVPIFAFAGRNGAGQVRLDVKESRRVPQVYVDSEPAEVPLTDKLKEIPDFRNAGDLAKGGGTVTLAIQQIGSPSSGAVKELERKNSNRVVARWILRQQIRQLYPSVVDALDLADPKFDARVELSSHAAAVLRSAAKELVETYLTRSELRYELASSYVVGPTYVSEASKVSFKHALHAAYSGLNELELSVARTLDDTGFTWVRNSSGDGYSIPLLDAGGTRRFFPDFLIWAGDRIVALDPKADHLLQVQASRKILDVRDDKGEQRLFVRLLSQGRWSANPIQVTDGGGYTVWSIKSGVLQAAPAASLKAAVAAALSVVDSGRCVNHPT